MIKIWTFQIYKIQSWIIQDELLIIMYELADLW